MLAGVCKATAEAFREVRRRRAVRVGPDGAVREPASGAFDVTVAPGENVQAAVDACPPGGSVLLLPGTHDGPLVLTADKVVHVFGRGLATLRAATGTVTSIEAETATLDGLFIRLEAGAVIQYDHDCVWIRGGRTRMQACDVSSAVENVSCIFIDGGADPLLISCKCVNMRDLTVISVRAFHAAFKSLALTFCTLGRWISRTRVCAPGV